MQVDSQPVAVLYGYKTKQNELCFIGRKGLITLSGERSKIEKILRHCNGLNTVLDIVKAISPIKQEEILELLGLCEKQGIVRDSRELYVGFHEDSMNPMIFSHALKTGDIDSIMKTERLRVRIGKTICLPKATDSNLLDTIDTRKSVRSFRAHELEGAQLSGLLKATYGIDTHWSVPSGGSMYPLDLYLIIPSECQVIPKGIYRWNPEQDNLTVISDKDPNLRLAKNFNTNDLTRNAACIICIAANLKRARAKYANRAYRHVLLEAGHAAQNSYLFCAEQNIGIVEYGGFNDRGLATELGLVPPHEIILSTLIVGTEESKKAFVSEDQENVTNANRLNETLVGPGKPITKVSVWEPEIKAYALSQWGASAEYNLPSICSRMARKSQRAFSTGGTSSEALIKVLAEGYERYALEQRRVDLIESAVNLGDQFLDPRVVVPYSSKQIKALRGIEEFNPKKRIDWVCGIRQNTKQRVWVPSDLVFYENRVEVRKDTSCYHANSSGVAAHFHKEEAIKTALYELIERDAFTVTWYGKRNVRALPHRHFPDSLRQRIQSLEKLGYKVIMLDLTIDGPPVVLVIIWSTELRPALSSGAACRPSLVDAATKAFDEAEFMAMTWYRRRMKKMQMTDIWSPDDHGCFYMDPKNLRHVKWLLDAQIREPITSDFGDLFCYDPVVVDITPKHSDCGLTVVRVLSEKLMPINFGYGSEHYRHHRMSMLGLVQKSKYPLVPHFFA